MKRVASIFLAWSFSGPALAQDITPGPIVAMPAEAAPLHVLPANTEISLRMNDTITTKGDAYSEGDTFSLSVVHDVMLDGYVVIPRNARAVGKIAWLTSKGAFGKSGKMEVALQYVDLSGRRLPIEGTYRQEGEGNTVATVGGVVAAGVFAGFITGKSATIPRGRELTARTAEDMPVRLASRPRPVTATAQASTWTPSAPRRPVQSAAPKQNWGVVEVTSN